MARREAAGTPPALARLRRKVASALSLVLLVAACGGGAGTFVLVDVTGAVGGLDHLDVAVANGGARATVEVPLPDGTTPTSFSLELPPGRSGRVDVTVEARAGAALLARGNGAGDIVPDGVTRVTVPLAPVVVVPPDLTMLPDLAADDLTSPPVVDLARDLATVGPDLTVADVRDLRMPPPPPDLTGPAPDLARAPVSFTSGFSSRVGPIGVADVVALDVGRDGITDLAVASCEGSSVTLYRNAGNGTAFTSTVIFAPPVGACPYQLAAGDVDRDGDTDLVVALRDVDRVVVLLQQPVLTPPTFNPLPPLTVGSRPRAVALGAFIGGDDTLDLAVAASGAMRVELYRGAGDGNFTLLGAVPTSGAVSALALGDFNRDRVPDVAAANPDRANAVVAYGPTFAGAAISFATSAMPVALSAIRLGGDAEPDLVVAASAANGLGLHVNPTFAPPSFQSTGAGPSDVVVAELDGDPDARDDVAVTCRATGAVEVLVGAGAAAGTLRPPRSFAVGGSPVAITAGDFDRDGRIDLAAVETTDNTLTVLLNATPR